MKPLVSILIPAYNAAETLAETLQSALDQTWSRKEIIVVNDGSRDNTREVAESFASKNVQVVTTENGGGPTARNNALKAAQGDYIQWLDADDLLVPDKIEKQLNALGPDDGPRVLLSGPWARFYYRISTAEKIETSLCESLSRADWMVRKLSENLHMQTGTWLTSRELTEAAGPWDPRLVFDDDGEYYGRVLLASERTLFVPDALVYYRVSPGNRVSHIGASDKKKDAMLISMKLHVQYMLSLEDSERSRAACLTYLGNWYPYFYPERQDIVAELQKLAGELGGKLEEPKLRWKYAWLKPIFGWKAAKWAQSSLPLMKEAYLRKKEKARYERESETAESTGSVSRA